MWSHSQTKPSLSHASLCIFSQPWTVLLNFPVPILDPRASILKVRLCSFLCLACRVHLVTLWRGVGYDYPLLDTSGTSDALTISYTWFLWHLGDFLCPGFVSFAPCPAMLPELFPWVRPHSAPFLFKMFWAKYILLRIIHRSLQKEVWGSLWVLPFPLPPHFCALNVVPLNHFCFLT